MKADKQSMRLYAVTDRAWLGENSLAEQIEAAILGGVTFVQLREKNLPFDAFVRAAIDIKKITDRYRIPFVINDNIDVALASDADGVHIGQTDEDLTRARKRLGTDKIIGVSVHSVAEAVRAEQNGADYLGIGAVFTTNTKRDTIAVEYDTIKEICRAVTIPAVAIGGISAKNILQLTGSGIDGVAVVSAIFAQPDIRVAAKELLTLSERMINGK